jgi:hypothetical protein
MFESLDDALLYEGLDDWVALVMAVSIVQVEQGLPSEADAVPPMLDVLVRLMSEGLFEAGSADSDGFHPWPASDTGHVARLQSLTERGGSEDWGYSAWFRLTAKGKARAEAVVPPPDDDFD